jgi:hypothetical protein
MKRGECRIDRLPRIAKHPVDIEKSVVVQAEAPSRAADDSKSSGGGKTVAFAPLFDPYTMLKAKESVHLRFRAREALSGIPIRSQDISFSLRHGAIGASRELPVKTVRRGVFEVAFTPEGPGQYEVTASIRGALPGSVPAVQLGVLGLVNRH